MKRSLSILMIMTLILSLSMVFVYGEPVVETEQIETTIEESVVEDTVDAELVEEEKEELLASDSKKVENSEASPEEMVEKVDEEVNSDSNAVATNGPNEPVELDEDGNVIAEEETVIEEEEERGVMSHDPMPAEDTPITEAPNIEFVKPSELPAEEAIALYNDLTISEKFTLYPILKVSVVLDYIFFFVFLAYVLFYIFHFIYVLVKRKSLRQNLSLRGLFLFIICVIFLVLQMNNMYVLQLTEILIRSRLGA